VGDETGRRAVLVPVKAFRKAKIRLAGVVPAEGRATLAREMAERVLAAASPLPVAVVCDDPEVADWARLRNARVVWEPGRGLNRAVQSGLRCLAAVGVEHVTVAHADLPLASDLGWVGRFGGVTLVPDRRDDGTNVIGLPARSGFVFSYGPGSFGRHLEEARRLCLPLRVVRSPDLTWDIDVPDDLAAIGLPA
jgi:2-phospho-L-lactate/phosphoenolpyruvate guanylyltransferase